MSAPELEDLATELRIAIMRTARILRTQASGDVVTSGQNSVLGLLEKYGPQSMRELADAEHVQAPSMTRTVNSLQEQGLVLREAGPGDRRQVLVGITDAGREALLQARELRSAWLAERLEQLNDKDRNTLHEAASLLVTMNQQQARRRAASL